MSASFIESFAINILPELTPYRYWYKQNILEKLGLLKVIDSKISELSGGELQKVYIAVCLGNEAEVYALDEPSAFIDVEDRLNVAEVIKEFIFDGLLYVVAISLGATTAEKFSRK